MKQLNSIEEMNTELTDDFSCVIYGAGKVGKSLALFLLKAGVDINKIKIVVSQNHAKAISIFGIKVREIQDIQFEPKNMVIVAVRPNNKCLQEIYETACLYTSKIVILSEFLCEELEKIYADECVQGSRWFRSLREKYPEQELQIRNNRYREGIQFEVHLTEHCNLNCKGCFHFSPLAKETYLSVEEYRRDCNRLSELYDKKAKYVMLLGGEPLLHPRINEFMEISRHAFPNTELSIVTNGLLLKSMPESFWLTCNKYNVIISTTKYPINIDYGDIEMTAKRYDVKYKYFNGDNPQKTLSFQPMDPSGKQAIEDNFYGCYRADECITLSHGRLYNCIMPAHLHHLNDYFNLGMPDFKEDGIDIYKVNDSREIDCKLTKPIKACAYCDRIGCIDGNEYELSKREMNEWIKTSI